MHSFESVYLRVTQYLNTKLPAYLSYHDAAHTLDVLHNVILMGEWYSLPERQLNLIKIAALYHDLGFIQSRENHEEISCLFAREELRTDGYSGTEIASVESMIMATKIPQNPLNISEAILADADLEYLGTNNYTAIAGKLYKELLFFDPYLTEKAWLHLQIDFLSSHQYHTDFCKQFREPVKQKNLEKLIQMLR